jgi:hypothetical protein
VDPTRARAHDRRGHLEVESIDRATLPNERWMSDHGWRRHYTSCGPGTVPSDRDDTRVFGQRQQRCPETLMKSFTMRYDARADDSAPEAAPDVLLPADCRIRAR